MTDYLQTFLLEHLEAAGFISILLNILISITGVFPSAPLTFVNVKLFGFWNGFSLSFIGEVLGAALSFWLYRKGFHTLVTFSLQVAKAAARTREREFYIDSFFAFTSLYSIRPHYILQRCRKRLLCGIHFC